MKTTIDYEQAREILGPQLYRVLKHTYGEDPSAFDDVILEALRALKIARKDLNNYRYNNNF